MTTMIDRLKAQIVAHETRLAMVPDDRQAQLRLEQLQTALHAAETRHADHADNAREQAREQAIRDDRLQKANKALQAMLRQREAEAREREERAAEQLEADLRAKYEAAAPGRVSDAEWGRVRTQILHDYRLEKMRTGDEAETRMRAAYRKSEIGLA